MKTSGALVAVLFPGCVSVPVQSPAGHVVAKAAHVMTSAHWAPTEEEIRPFEASLVQVFVDPPHQLAGRMRFPLSEYVVRYSGDVLDGKKIIAAEGIHVSQKSLAALKEEHDRTDGIVRMTFGGGALYFTAVYDAEAKTMKSFYFNAPK